MRYQEFPPGARLAPVVDCFWALEHDGDAAPVPPEPVAPDGRPELVFHCGEPFVRIHPDGRRERQRRALLIGQMTGPIVLKPGDAPAVIGVRFRPAGLHAFLQCPQHLLRDRVEALDDVWPALAGALRDRLLAAPAAAARIAVLRQALHARLDPDRQADRAVDAAVAIIRASGGRASIDAAVRASGVSARQLERKFSDRVGIGPKTFSRIIRFQHAFRALSDDRAPAAGVALDYGFYDQAHFIRDVKMFTGQSPSAYFLSERRIATFFLEHHRQVISVVAPGLRAGRSVSQSQRPLAPARRPALRVTEAGATCDVSDFSNTGLITYR